MVSGFNLGAPRWARESLIKKIPKVELHVHIVGSVRAETLLRLIEEGHLDSDLRSLKDVEGLYRFRDFPHFISVYSKVVDCITDEKQFEHITYQLLEGEARCNVKYVEASFSPMDHALRGLDYGEMLDSINRGVARARAEFGVICNLRVDLVRNYGPEKGMEVLNWVEEKGENIISVDIGGSEERFPPKPYAKVFKRAREMGLHTVAHAGEAAGPDSIWEALRLLKVERIGHGVAAKDDSSLIDYLMRRGIGVEACPTSNIRTGVIPSLSEHPIRRFFETGLKVSVNTDDPSMFRTDMNKEYLQLHRELGFTVDELYRLSLNALETSFLPREEKIRMMKLFEEEYRRLS
ncbi:MAG: adenosine deaminase [Candidatus Bathyarchaeia archaeon]